MKYHNIGQICSNQSVSRVQNKFFLYQWKKHGLPYAISAPMYLYYALAIRHITHPVSISTFKLIA